MAESILGLAYRLKQVLIRQGRLTREEAGRIAAEADNGDWDRLPFRNRIRWISWAAETVRWMVRDLPFPAQETGDGWECVPPGMPITCDACGRVLGWATEDRNLRLAFLGEPAVVVEDGHIRCPCGKVRDWVRWNGTAKVGRADEVT